MPARIALVHTVPALAQQFRVLTEELLPGAEVVDSVVEHLLERTVAEGRLSERTRRELAGVIGELAADSDVVMVTCSSLGPAVDALRDTSGPPVLRVDEAMARRAVQQGDRIGVLATLTSTLEPTATLLERVGRDEGRAVTVVAHLCEGAFEAVRSGDGKRHDELVRAGLDTLVSGHHVDVVVLAQASMARVVEALDDEPPVPALSSPRLAVERLASVLAER